MNAARVLTVFLFAVAIAGAVGVLIQRQRQAALREEIALLQRDQKEVATVQAENQRLKAAQLNDVELAKLRADHAAVERLRGELNTVRDAVRKAEAASAGAPNP